MNPRFQCVILRRNAVCLAESLNNPFSCLLSTTKARNFADSASQTRESSEGGFNQWYARPFAAQGPPIILSIFIIDPFGIFFVESILLPYICMYVCIFFCGGFTVLLQPVMRQSLARANEAQLA